MDIDLKQFVTVGENGELSVDQDGFDVALRQHTDSHVSKGVDSFKKKNESADSKLLKQIEDLTLAYNKSECKAILAGDLFTDKERELLLGSLVTKDLTKSMETLNALVTERKAVYEAKTQSIISSLQSGQPSVSNEPTKPVQKVEKTGSKTFQQNAQQIKDYFK